MKNLILFAALAALLSGCGGRSPKVSKQVTKGTEQISKGIEERTGHGLNPASQPTAFALPPGVSTADGLAEDEGIAVALWNNAAFQADLTALGFARADLVEAGQLRNPMLTLLLPWGAKQFEATANLPLEIFWQRPRRVAAAKVELERVGESLVQTGLNLVRDVRLAYADLAIATERSRIASASLQQRREVAQIVQAKLRDGDISEMETAPSRLDVKQAEELVARLEGEAAVARERLRFLLGMGLQETPFELVALLPAPTWPAAEAGTDAAQSVTIPHAGPLSGQNIAQQNREEVSDLVKQAFASRPDLRAAELAMEAAGKRARWERSRIFSLTAMIDANGQGKEGFEAGPGVQVELPIFNRNKGGITRAEAEIERAARQYAAVRQRIVLEVREAYAQLVQSRQVIAAWRNEILPVIEEEIRTAERAYADGEVAYLFVLETSRKRFDARLQGAEASAAYQRAVVQLERAVGKKISEGKGRETR